MQIRNTKFIKFATKYTSKICNVRNENISSKHGIVSCTTCNMFFFRTNLHNISLLRKLYFFALNILVRKNKCTRKNVNLRCGNFVENEKKFEKSCKSSPSSNQFCFQSLWISLTLATGAFD